MKLQTVICSTRPNRVGPHIARWFQGLAEGHDAFEATLVDLADFNLPIFNEPWHPRLRNYQFDYTKAWSASVESADAYVFVMPEYNYMPPPAFVNAVDYLYSEWNGKPAAFVSYGGQSGGVRAVQVAKQMLTTVKIMPLVEAVAIPMVGEYLDAEKGFTPTEAHGLAAKVTLDELARWSRALKAMRES